VAQLKVFATIYEVALRGSGKGPRDLYRKGAVHAYVAAATAQGVAAVLTSNLTLAGSEVIDIIDIHEEGLGGQGIYT
jgi:hypothetical protein